VRFVRKGQRRRFSFASPLTATVLGGLVLVLIAAVAPLSMLAGQPVLTQLLQSYPDVVPLAAVGLIVAWRRPANPIGWLILLTEGPPSRSPPSSCSSGSAWFLSATRWRPGGDPPATGGSS